MAERPFQTCQIAENHPTTRGVTVKISKVPKQLPKGYLETSTNARSSAGDSE